MAKAIVSVKFAKDFVNVVLVASLNESLTSAIKSAPHTTVNKIVKIEITGLTANTKYYYGIEINGVLQSTGRGQLKTFPNGAGSFSCCFASCAATGSNHEVFEVIRSLNPDFFIHMGDFHYSDIITNNIDLFRTAYDNVFASPRQAKLYGEIPTSYMWDDHDYASNNANSTAASKTAASLAYREFVPHYPLSSGADANPIYQSFVVGRVRFIMTDLRFNKSPQTTPESDTTKTMMGETQIQWFFNELLKPEPVKIWVSTVPWIGTSTTDLDYWGSYTNERKRIANFIKNNQLAGKVAIISGDMHAVALDTGTNSDYADGGGAPIPVFQAAQLDKQPSTKGGPWTYGPFTSSDGGQYGTMNVHDTGGTEIKINWMGRRLREVIATHTFTVPAVATATVPEETLKNVTDLKASEILESSLKLTWNPSTQASTNGYEVYVDGTLKGTTEQPFLTVTSLTNGTHTFLVKAKNAFGVTSTGTSVQATMVVSVPTETLPAANLKMNIDAFNANSFTIDGSAMSISKITDLTGNGNNLVYSGGSASSDNRPFRLPTSKYNGLPVWTMDGAKGQMNAILKNTTFNKEATIFFVAALTLPNGSSQRLWDMDNGTKSLVGMQKSGSAMNIYLGYNADASKTGGPSVSNMPDTLHLFSFVFSETTSLIYINSTLTDTNTPIPITDVTNFKLGYRIGAVTYGNANVGEVAMYDRALSGLELQRAQTFLMQKWQIT